MARPSEGLRLREMLDSSCFESARGTSFPIVINVSSLNGIAVSVKAEHACIHLPEYQKERTNRVYQGKDVDTLEADHTETQKRLALWHRSEAEIQALQHGALSNGETNRVPYLYLLPSVIHLRH